MALAIRVVPTLHGEVAKKFEAAAKKVENNPGTQDYSCLLYTSPSPRD